MAEPGGVPGAEEVCLGHQVDIGEGELSGRSGPWEPRGVLDRVSSAEKRVVTALSEATRWGPRVAMLLEGPGSARSYRSKRAGRVLKTPTGHQQRWCGIDLNRMVVETRL